MAVVNAIYEFIMCDIRTNGRVSDGGVLENTVLKKKKLFQHAEYTPRQKPTTLHDTASLCLCYEAFTLRKHFMKPFSQRDLTHDRRVFTIDYEELAV